jgi:hypothetical protein
MFGVLYGLGTIALVVVLDALGAPTFYDKLLPVPILNLMVRRLDKVGAALRLPARLDLSALTPRQRRLGTAGLWIVVFAGISAAGGLGDDHPGQYLPFWSGACETSGSERACAYVATMQANYCDRGSGWACNELGIHRVGLGRDRAAARGEFERACSLGFMPGCDNVLRIATGSESFASGPPPTADLPVVLRGSKGVVTERDPDRLRALGCARGWTELCTGPSE